MLAGVAQPVRRRLPDGAREFDQGLLRRGLALDHVGDLVVADAQFLPRRARREGLAARLQFGQDALRLPLQFFAFRHIVVIIPQQQ